LEDWGIILSFNKGNLAKALGYYSEFQGKHNFPTPADITQKSHYKILLSYLSSSELSTKTIVIERNYISSSFLKEYASFYSLSSDAYSKYTVRIHFFGRSCTSIETLKRYILNNSKRADDFFDSYNGYVVVKPLPHSVIGVSLLKTYDINAKNGDKRYYNSLVNYKVNFFGKDLEIDSLVFQEQDGITSNCASIYLWSSFHKISDLTNNRRPHPAEITQVSGIHSSGRTFPSSGINHLQINRVLIITT